MNYYEVEVLYTAENAFIPVHYMQSKLEGKSRWSVISQLADFSLILFVKFFPRPPLCKQNNISFIYLWVGEIKIAHFIEDAE